ncbi:hypothetical protein Fcan01_24429 [Folsomia candida]|uniref:Uncharacterized protein n=1 Tax=Folsomia candida TaxID=158441 RepID=A0A226D7B0_FOLCA|nr:hypothetical protein Fcan01_24429 [Folsomia candida]
MSSVSWIFLFITILATLSHCSNQWSGIFLDADLTFIFSPMCKKHFFTPWRMTSMKEFDIAMPDFPDVTASNTYTPLRIAFLCHDWMEVSYEYSTEHLKVFRYREIEKSARPKAAFVRFDWTNERFAMGKCDALLIFLKDNLAQDYVFGRFSQTYDCYYVAPRQIGTSMMAWDRNASPTGINQCQLPVDKRSPYFDCVEEQFDNEEKITHFGSKTDDFKINPFNSKPGTFIFSNNLL